MKNTINLPPRLDGLTASCAWQTCFGAVIFWFVAMILTVTMLSGRAMADSPGFDGLRDYGGSGYGRLQYPHILTSDGLALYGSLAAGWAPSWIANDAGVPVWNGGLSRQRIAVTKAFFGFEFWGSLGMGQTQRVTGSTEWLTNVGDWNVGAKYSIAAGSAWRLAPFVEVRMLSPVKDEGSWSDTVSLEIGGAVAWEGYASPASLPIRVTFNLSYDYDNSYRLLTPETRRLQPATPFERISWGMSQWPYLRSGAVAEYLLALAQPATILVGLDAAVPLETNNFGLDRGLYNASLGWRQRVDGSWMYDLRMVLNLPSNSDPNEIPSVIPWQVQAGIGYRFGEPFLAVWPERATPPQPLPEDYTSSVSDAALIGQEAPSPVSEMAVGVSDAASGVSEAATGVSEAASGVSEAATGISETASGVSIPTAPAAVSAPAPVSDTTSAP